MRSPPVDAAHPTAALDAPRTGGEAHRVECLPRLLATARERHARVQEPVGDVVEHALVLGEEELLEDETNLCRAQRRQLSVGEFGDIKAGDTHRPSGRAFESAHEVKQRRLARARRPNDGEQFARADGEAHAAKCLNRRLARKDLRDVSEFEDGVDGSSHQPPRVM